MPTITYTEQLVTVTCVCGINYAIPQSLDSQLRDHRGPSGKQAYCPLGHNWHYTGKTEAEKLREQLDRQGQYTASLLARLDQEKASHASTKGQLTKTKKRAANGVCPCCNRSFVQLSRHMKTKHPDYATAAEVL